VSGANVDEMNAKVRSSLLGGLIAAVIWMVIASLSEASKWEVVGWGLGLLVFTFAVSMVISRVVHRDR
jgi:VIT1/CCC1 family predicted Fe2+/Mn2+ transporter